MLLWLGMAALVLGAALPRGWMPGQASDGSFAITICSEGLSPTEQDALLAKASAAMAEMAGSSDDAPADHQDPVKHCPYGVVAHAAAIDVPSIDLAVPTHETELPASLPAVGIGYGLAAPPPPSTGPPIQA